MFAANGSKPKIRAIMMPKVQTIQNPCLKKLSKQLESPSSTASEENMNSSRYIRLALILTAESQ